MISPDEWNRFFVLVTYTMPSGYAGSVLVDNQPLERVMEWFQEIYGTVFFSSFNATPLTEEVYDMLEPEYKQKKCIIED